MSVHLRTKDTQDDRTPPGQTQEAAWRRARVKALPECCGMGHTQTRHWHGAGQGLWRHRKPEQGEGREMVGPVLHRLHSVEEAESGGGSRRMG